MEYEQIKTDLVNVLKTLTNKELTDKEKISISDKSILDIIKYISPIIDLEKKKEKYIGVAYNILTDKRGKFIGVDREEYFDTHVEFSFYIDNYDYSAGRDSDSITHEEIEK